MFNASKIQSALFGLVGIRQPADDTLPIIYPENQEAQSGLYLDDVAPFNLLTIKDAQTYVKPEDPDFVEKFNTFIENTKKSAISTIMTQVFDKPDYIDRNLLFINESPRNTLEEFPTELAFMGYEITPSKTKNLGFKIPRVHCQFDFDGYEIAVIFFLFNSEKSTNIFTEPIVLTSNDEWVELNWTIDSTMGDYKGSYYFLIGVPVLEAEKLRFQPWKRDYNDANDMNNISELCIERVLFNDGIQITNFNSSLKIETSQNVGMNLDISVFCDYTDLIINNKNLFTKAIQLQAVITFMMMVATSMRSNRNERLSKEVISMIMVYVNGTNPDGSFTNTGLNKSLFYEIETLRKETNKLREGYFGGQLMVGTVW